MRVLGVLLFLSLAIALAGGVTGRGGFEAVAFSAQGKLVAVGGQNRVLYLLDSDKLEVKSRFWIGARLGRCAFSKDGTRILVEDETDRLQLLDVSSGKVLAKLDKVTGLFARSSLDLAIVRDLEELTKHRLLILSLSKLEEIQRVHLPDRPIAWTLDESGKQLLVLGAGKTGEEKVIPVTEIPRDLAGLARWTFRQKHDGLESTLYQIEIATGKILGTTTSWYTSDSDSTQLGFLGSTMYIFNRVNLCARVERKGATTLFETSQGVNHALAISPNGKLLLTGGLQGGTLSTLEDNRKTVFHLNELPGQTEYLNRFDFQEDGSSWAVTSAYRLVRISRTGRIEKIVPVY